MNEEIGNFKKAYENYVAGGALRKKLLNYDLAQDQQLNTKQQHNIVQQMRLESKYMV